MAVKEHDLDQPMDKLLDIAKRKFGDVEFQSVVVGDVSLEVLQIKNMQQYIDKLMDQTRSGKKVALPLWAKIWPASVVMGYSLAKYPFTDTAAVLEIGGGATVNALALAKRGIRTTVVDVDPDALLFSRINALKNGVGELVTVQSTDFVASLDRRFDYIVSCEMLYDEKQFDDIAGFVDSHLSEGDSGEIMLSLDLKRAAQGFFQSLSTTFKMMKTSATFTDQETGDQKNVNLFRLKRK